MSHGLENFHFVHHSWSDLRLHKTEVHSNLSNVTLTFAKIFCQINEVVGLPYMKKFGVGKIDKYKPICQFLPAKLFPVLTIHAAHSPVFYSPIDSD